MKKSIKRTFEVLLLLVAIACLFVPFAHNITPLDVMFPTKMKYDIVFLTLPVSLLVILLLVVILQEQVSKTLIRVLTFLFLVIYLIVLTEYLEVLSTEPYFVWDTLTFAILLSILLVVLTFISQGVKAFVLQNIILATITLPFVAHMVYIFNGFERMNTGGLVIEATFSILYLIAVYNIFHKPYRKVRMKAKNTVS